MPKTKIVHIVLVVPENSETYMDILSAARDDSNGEIVQWAHMYADELKK